jgi:hypothetical protein
MVAPSARVAMSMSVRIAYLNAAGGRKFANTRRRVLHARRCGSLNRLLETADRHRWKDPSSSKRRPTRPKSARPRPFTSATAAAERSGVGTPGPMRQRGEATAAQVALAREAYRDQGAEGQRSRGREVVPAGEVAQRVGDQLSAVVLDAAQDVGPRAEHQIRARVHRRVRERARVAAVLAHGDLPTHRDTDLVAALSAGVRHHHHQLGALDRRAHEPPHPRQVAQLARPAVGGEADRGHADPVAAPR